MPAKAGRNIYAKGGRKQSLKTPYGTTTGAEIRVSRIMVAPKQTLGRVKENQDGTPGASEASQARNESDR